MENPIQKNFDEIHSKLLTEIMNGKDLKTELFELIRSYNNVCRAMDYEIKHSARPEL